MNQNQVNRNRNPLLSMAVTGGFDEFTGSGIVLAAAEKPVFTIGTPAISDTDNFSDVSLDRDGTSDSASTQLDAFFSPLAELDSMGNLQQINSAPTLDLNQDQQQVDANLNPISAALAQLPNAASTVFSTFTNIIKGSQPRLDEYQQHQSQAPPMMEPMQEPPNPTGYMFTPSFDPNAPPPAFFSPGDESLFKKQTIEPANNNTFRLGGQKKKTYAHIPGLSMNQQTSPQQTLNAAPVMPPMPPQPAPTVEPVNHYQEFQPQHQPAVNPYMNQQREPEKTNKFSLTSLLPSQLLEKIPSSMNLFGSSEPSQQYKQHQQQPYSNEDFSVMTSTFDQPPTNFFNNQQPQNTIPFAGCNEVINPPPQNVSQGPSAPVNFFSPQQFKTSPFAQQASEPTQSVVNAPLPPPMATPPQTHAFHQTAFNPSPLPSNPIAANQPPQIAAVSADTNCPPPTFFNPNDATQMFKSPQGDDGRPKNPYSSSRISRRVGMYKPRTTSETQQTVQPAPMPPMPTPEQQNNFYGNSFPMEQQQVPSRPPSIPPLPGNYSANQQVEVTSTTNSVPTLMAPSASNEPPAGNFFYQPPVSIQQPSVPLYQEPAAPGLKKSDLNVPEVNNVASPLHFFQPQPLQHENSASSSFFQPPPMQEVNQPQPQPSQMNNSSVQNFFQPPPVSQAPMQEFIRTATPNQFQQPPQPSRSPVQNFFEPPPVAQPSIGFFQPRPSTEVDSGPMSFSQSSPLPADSNATQSFFPPPSMAQVEASSAPSFFEPPPIENPPKVDEVSNVPSSFSFFQPPPPENTSTPDLNDSSSADYELLSNSSNFFPPPNDVQFNEPSNFFQPPPPPTQVDSVFAADRNISESSSTPTLNFFQSNSTSQAGNFIQNGSRSNSLVTSSINFFQPIPSAPEEAPSQGESSSMNSFFENGAILSPIEALPQPDELPSFASSVNSISVQPSNIDTATEMSEQLESLSLLSDNIGSTLSLFATSELDASSIQKPIAFDSMIPKYLDAQIASSIERSTASPTLSQKPYRPVYRHWFYQSLYWHPFAMTDSMALDEAFNAGREFVVTDGGRCEVNLKDKKRSSIYWSSGKNAIRRCSWFYKNPRGNEQNLIPFEEATADFMESEYEQALLHNIWNRRLQIPNSDDYLSFMDAANFEYHQMGQTLTVKRGVDEFVIDDGEEGVIDHLIISISNFGDKIDDSADELRSKCFETVQHYYSDAFDCAQIGRLEVLPISLNSIDVLKMKDTNAVIEAGLGGNGDLPATSTYQDIIMKTAFYCNQDYYHNIMNHLAFSLKEIVAKFFQRNPDFKGEFSLISTSFEALFLFDLLLNQDSGPDFWKLNFKVTNFYAFGMPSNLLTIRNADKLQSNFELKDCKKFLNVVHRLDPIAQRIEPLIKPEFSKTLPESIENETANRIDYTIADGSSLESFSLKNYFTSELIILRITNEIYGSLRMDSGSL